MPRLNWSTIGERFYEMGVDRGVLYVGNDPGVSWTGLISISESPTGGEAKPYYIDGFKYLNISSAEEFEATIEAYFSPPEFGPCDGTVSIQNGLFVTQQPRKSFGLSYRTKVGNDVDGSNHAYKIHLVYNALAAPSERDNTTLGEAEEPSSFSWAITTLAPGITGFKPTSHFMIDSRKTPPNLLTALEDILYGVDFETPRLPTAQELTDLFTSPGPVLRQNLAMDPAATAILVSDLQIRWAPNFFGAAPAAGTSALQTGPGPVPEVTTFIRKTWTVGQSTPTANTGFGHGKDTNGFPVTPGQTFTCSSYLRSSASGKKANLRFRYFNSAGVRMTGVGDGPVIDLVPGQWTRISHTHTVPPGAAWVVIWSDTALPLTAWAAGDTLDGTALLVETGSVLGSYFDGATLDYNGVFFDWDGTPNNSSSSLRSWL